MFVSFIRIWNSIFNSLLISETKIKEEKKEKDWNWNFERNKSKSDTKNRIYFDWNMWNKLFRKRSKSSPNKPNNSNGTNEPSLATPSTTTTTCFSFGRKFDGNNAAYMRSSKNFQYLQYESRVYKKPGEDNLLSRFWLSHFSHWTSYSLNLKFKFHSFNFGIFSQFKKLSNIIQITCKLKAPVSTSQHEPHSLLHWLLNLFAIRLSQFFPWLRYHN